MMLMNLLRNTAFLLLGASLVGFVWLAWFLIATPAESFDTQGPGLLAAFVMIGSQVLGVLGIALIAVWKFISLWTTARQEGRNE